MSEYSAGHPLSGGVAIQWDAAFFQAANSESTVCIREMIVSSSIFRAVSFREKGSGWDVTIVELVGVEYGPGSIKGVVCGGRGDGGDVCGEGDGKCLT